MRQVGHQKANADDLLSSRDASHIWHGDAKQSWPGTYDLLSLAEDAEQSWHQQLFVKGILRDHQKTKLKLVGGRVKQAPMTFCQRDKLGMQLCQQ
jgi:hypothetical protein